MANAKKNNLLEQFKKVEEQLIELLKFEGVQLDENLPSKEIKTQLKAYIKKVNKAKALFEKYELLASEIEALTLADVNSDKLIESVVELREDEKTTEIYENDIVVNQGEVKVVKKKTKAISKEL